MEQGYLGTHKGLAYKDNYTEQFRSMSPAGPRLWGNLNQAGTWAEQVLSLKRREYPQLDRLLLSSEMFTNRNKINDRPIIGFLKKFNEKVLSHGKVQVLLIIRNPAERIASGYAQVSISNPHASQEHFEQHVERQLKRGNRIAYDQWVAELYEALGEENVCVLLMEEIRKLTFWHQLKKFCKLQNFEPKEWLANTPNTNTRKEDEAIWQLRPYEPAYKAKGFSSDIFGFLWPPYLAGAFRSRVYQAFKNKATQYYRKRYGHMEGNGRGGIQLTPQLKEQIQVAYAQQTKNLSELLRKDMQGLGY